MKPALIAVGSAVVGAVAAAALIHAIPALSPHDADDAAATEAAAATPATEEGVIPLDRAAMVRAGIHIATLAPAKMGTQRTGFARTLDIGPLSAIDSEIVSARAALTASQADYARQRALAAEDQSAATRAVEMARAQAAADQARVSAAMHRVGLEFGPGLAGLSGPALSQLVRAIAAGEASLVRIDFTDGPAPRGALVRIGEDGATTTVTLLGAAAATDARLQTAGSLAIVRGPVARLLGAGRVIPASMMATTGSETGTIVPRDAILRFQGGLWVYRTVRGGFSRVELTGARAEAGGWFTGGGVRPGDTIAAGGVAVLLSLERGGTPVEDE